MDLETKALLLGFGTVQLNLPGVLSPPEGRVSTAGPGAGGQSVFFRSGLRMVRLSVTESSPLRLEQRGGGAEGEVCVFNGEREIASGRIIKPLLHCPEQAYITVSERCIYNCKFCAVPKLRGGVKSLGTVREMVAGAQKTGLLRAISLTSGVEISPRHEAERVAKIALDLKAFGLPLGISVSPFPGVNQLLKRAGADEVKYNLETADLDLFQQVCPGISFQEIMDALQEAVDVFGRTRVFSNIILGLGESDKVLRHGIDELAEMGVMPILRAVYPHPLRAGDLEMTRPSPQRLLALACHLKRALEKNDLRGDLAETGCYRCTGCDLVPHRDL